MTTSRTKRRAALAALLLAGASVPAIGLTQDRPESLLPPGFDDPAAAPAPAPAPAATRAPNPAQTIQDLPAPSNDAPPGNTIAAAADKDAAEQPPVDLTKYELPAFA